MLLKELSYSDLEALHKRLERHTNYTTEDEMSDLLELVKEEIYSRISDLKNEYL